jgi:TnpA family transposase
MKKGTGSLHETPKSKSVHRIGPTPINWELIEEQLDAMVKHYVALKMNLTDAESLLRRFIKNNGQHPLTKLSPSLVGSSRAYSSADTLLPKIYDGKSMQA